MNAMPDMLRAKIGKVKGNIGRIMCVATLPLSFAAETDLVDPVCFRKWSIFIEHRRDELELWKHHGLAPVAAEEED